MYKKDFLVIEFIVYLFNDKGIEKVLKFFINVFLIFWISFFVGLFKFEVGIRVIG